MHFSFSTRIFLVCGICAVAIGVLFLMYSFHTRTSTSLSRVSQVSSYAGKISNVYEYLIGDAKKSPDAPSTVTILFGGDMMFDRSIREKIEAKGSGFVFAPLHDLLAHQDLVMANLEGPITTANSSSVGSTPGSAQNYVFTFPDTTAALLAAEHIQLVNIGNNHSDDFGGSGIAQTRGYLTAVAVKYFGNVGGDETHRYLIQDVRGVRVGFVNYNQFIAHGTESALADIALLRPQVNVLVVYTHWGTEYVSTASQQIQTLAHIFVDAGADVVIGSHPHIVQQKEEYKGKWIYYSLGNLIFDQYFQPETQEGLLVELNIDSKTKELWYVDIPIILQPTGQTTLKKD